ncbi:MAG: hypothetical protein H6948_02235 [Zoogloeaceae bacterium]|nr:hypothetical protein [Zoogloeaceae bacterium]
MARTAVSATITGENQFTPWFSFRPTPGEKHCAGLYVGPESSFSGTIVLQTKRPGADDATAQDIPSQTFTSPTAKTLEFAHDIEVRVGCKTGGYTSGSIDVEISE